MPTLTIIQNTSFKKIAAPAAKLPPQEKFAVAVGQFFTVRYAFKVGNHCFVELPQPLGSIGKIGYFYLPHVKVPLQELRGVWLTNTDSDILHSRQNLRQGFQTLKDLGFNTIYPVVWQRGYTLYPSPIAQAFFGAAITPDPRFATRDLLAEVVEEAKPFNFRVIPWFEYGLSTPPNSPLATQRPDLISSDQQGNPIFADVAWLNPCQPEVQAFMAELIADVAERYEIDGIQLDDHFGFPAVLGYDAFSQALYQQENQGKPMPQNPKDLQRQQWFIAKVTALLQRIFSSVKTQRDALISLSPNPLGFARQNFHVDWRLWEQEGLVEELVVQVYRDDLTSFTAEVNKAEIVAASAHIPTAIGVLCGLRIRSVSFTQINEQVQKTRDRQLAGVSCFFYETLLCDPLSPEKVQRNPVDLQRLFPPFQDSPFSDIDTHWAKACIIAVAERGILRGYPDRTFRPDAGMTRAEFAALMAAAFPNAPTVRPPINFTDVSVNDWFYTVVRWAYERGLLSGYPDGTFRPNQTASRLEAILSLMTTRSVSNPWSPNELLRFYFEDVGQIPAWARKATSDAIVAELIVNYPQVRQLRPTQKVTRGEVSALVCRTLKLADPVPLQYATWYWGLYDIRGALTVPFATWRGSGRLMRDIQVRLSELGLYPANEINGAYNWRTEQGLTRFCNALGLPNMRVGVFDEPFANALINTTVRFT
ncbi:family 10 glycosylhydrolase [Egbenema bharatensis]|uniref:family 10 glycosylhydrolase n=1 Tax=Egbenema bharatensis TaxID=3463334 RepID=UPI003A8B2858